MFAAFYIRFTERRRSLTCRFATDRNDFRRNLLVNLGLFAAGVWVARNLSDFDLLSPQPVT
ncbi:mitochondrial import receptor subunit TOM6 homolog [Anoplopoma fimbria]|uniref:mitochondrial import receptor subunit TOM6 homolog n=1 Tax=Anoplopoma fimbria TaxID=229290 RepID=UPI0023ECA8FC|nr:mitochondrial import receptor subunit TOM6 homolog [Anoplopoma fimbria]